MNRQRRWQIKQRKVGNCVGCGKPAQGRSLCDECAVRKGKVKSRRPLKSLWKAVNWNKPVKTIALNLGVTRSAVYMQRRKHVTTTTSN